jgi:GntR family phosphonate transport system transcriptional regulator
MTQTAKTPLWQAISRALRAEIADRIYAPGDQLPTEAALSERFGVNRHTVRRAIADLAEAGIVRSRRGAGVFVVARATDYRIGTRVRFHQNVLAAGQTPGKRVLQIEQRPAAPHEAERLALPDRAMLCVQHGLSLADGNPIALSASHFPLDRLPGIADALAEEPGVTQALRRCGVADYTRASTRISARPATATQALHLHLSEGAPLLYATSLNVDEAGQPVEFGMTWFAGDRVTLTVGPEEGER